jgi:hypothetical protein
MIFITQNHGYRMHLHQMRLTALNKNAYTCNPKNSEADPMQSTFHSFVLASILLILSHGMQAQSFSLPLEKDPNQTVTYEEMMRLLRTMEKLYPEVRLDSLGLTDIGLPLYYLVVANDPSTTRNRAIEEDKAILFINNGIHPGEPEGIDATLLLVRDILESKDKKQWLDHVVLVIVPCYNIDGMLQRNRYSRANQNGPESYGFRGNARNLDLNRDFIKADSKNARTFAELYHQWLPHIFLDNHTSNGADYQHTMTLLPTLPDKMGSPARDVMQQLLLPDLYRHMEEAGWPMCPYVVTRGQDPVEGIYAFNDSPRYSSGYAALFGSIALLTETHMLKPFIDRMESTRILMHGLVEWAALHARLLIANQDAHLMTYQSIERYGYNWQISTERADSILFLGYERELQPSQVSGKPLGKYNREKPYSKKIPYYPDSKPRKQVDVPHAYLIPQAWSEVTDRLIQNNIEMHRLEKDTLMTVQTYRIEDYKTLAFPYEGHYLHYDIHAQIQEELILIRKGDWYVPVRQPGIRYLLETLEPDGEDSFFAWNFFDGILMAKEGFSDYVFDDLAGQILANDETLRITFETRKKEDKKFADDSRAQLQFIYESSPYCEPTRNRYPVYRMMTP